MKYSVATATATKSHDTASRTAKQNSEGGTYSRENEPDRIIARELTARFASKGGRLANLNAAELTTIAETLLAILVEHGWRIHKDYPVCHVCREKVEDMAQIARAWGETQGAALAARIIAEARAIPATMKGKAE